MIIKKTIEVTQEACDICERPTKRGAWSVWSNYRFCQKHKWVEGILDIVKAEKKNWKNQDSNIGDMVKFIKEKALLEFEAVIKEV